MVKSAKTDHTNQPITVQEISDLFTDSVFKKPDIMGKTSKPVNLAPQMCILYYILLYEETLESQRKNLGKIEIRNLTICVASVKSLQMINMIS